MTSSSLCLFCHLPTPAIAKQSHIEAAFLHEAVSFGPKRRCKPGQVMILFDRPRAQMALARATGEQLSVSARDIWPHWNNAEHATIWSVEFLSALLPLPLGLDLRLTRQGILVTRDRAALVSALALSWLLPSSTASEPSRSHESFRRLPHSGQESTHEIEATTPADGSTCT